MSQSTEIRQLRRRVLLAAALSGFAFAAMALLTLLPRAIERGPDYGFERTTGTVRIVQPKLLTALRWTALAAVAASCVCGMWVRDHSVDQFQALHLEKDTSAGASLLTHPAVFWGSTLFFPTALVLLYPVVVYLDFVSQLAPWRVEDRLETADGRAYLFLDSSFLQGQTMALATLEEDNPIWLQAHVHGTTNGDSPRSWASVVRPSPLRVDDYGQLYLGPQGLLLGIRYENHCYLAYDPATDRLWAQEDVLNLSPFTLLDRNSKLHAPDVASTEQALRDGGDSWSLPGPTTAGVPRAAALQADSTHSNPEVPPLAKRWLEMSEELTKRFPSRSSHGN